MITSGEVYTQYKARMAMGLCTGYNLCKVSRAMGAKTTRWFLYSRACSALTVLPFPLTHIITPSPAELGLCQLWAPPCRSTFSSPYVWHMASFFPVFFCEIFLVTEPVLLMQKSEKNVYPGKHFFFFLNSKGQTR